VINPSTALIYAVEMVYSTSLATQRVPADGTSSSALILVSTSVNSGTNTHLASDGTTSPSFVNILSTVEAQGSSNSLTRNASDPSTSSLVAVEHTSAASAPTSGLSLNGLSIEHPLSTHTVMTFIESSPTRGSSIGMSRSHYVASLKPCLSPCHPSGAGRSA
jgi:hypothetical protein